MRITTQPIGAGRLQFGERVRARSTGAVALLIVSAALPAIGQPVDCADIASNVAMSAALGLRVVAAAPVARDTGVTECNWVRTADTPPTVSVRHFDRRAILANPVARTPESYLELLESAGEEVAGRRREPLPGGGKAVLIPGNGQWLVVVQRPDGVLRVVVNLPARATAFAVARAVGG